MNKKKSTLMIVTAAAALILIAWSLVGYRDTRGIEEPAYTLEKKTGEYEIRRYSPQLRAEVVIEGGYRQSLYAGFRPLADFIFGNNTARADISMTAPVLAQTSQTIAMTAPVLHEQERGDRHVISFVMPAEYSLETLPRPRNTTVTIRKISEQRMAAVTFRGYATERRSQRRIQSLTKALARDNVRITGMPQIAQYNPPWTPPYMRRNEILIPVE